MPQRKEEREIIRKREVDIIEESSNGLGWLKDNLVLTSVLQAGVPHTRSGCPGPLQGPFQPPGMGHPSLGSLFHCLTPLSIRINANVAGVKSCDT